jgi:glycerophosphoryl diester phosphodiesterase
MRIFAHRGLHDQFPENSIPAIQNAFEHEVLHVEIDVRRCKTGEIIVFHDRSLKRMTGLKKFVINTPFSVIKNLHLRNSSGKATPWHIPTLTEVLEKFSSRVEFILDVKKETWIDDGLEWNLISILREFDLIDSIVISSFNPFVLKRIQTIEPAIHTGLIVSHPAFIKLFMTEKTRSVHIPYRYIDHGMINLLRSQGKDIFVWTLNDMEAAKKIDSMNHAFAAITDIPEQMITELVHK